MATHLLSTERTRRASEQLLEALRRRRDTDRAVDSSRSTPGLRATDAHRAVVEQAKGALAKRFGLDAHHAFAVVVIWSRLTRVPLHTSAESLLRACEGSSAEVFRDQPLVGWLEHHLGDGADDPARRPGDPLRPARRE